MCVVHRDKVSPARQAVNLVLLFHTLFLQSRKSHGQRKTARSGDSGEPNSRPTLMVNDLRKAGEKSKKTKSHTNCVTQIARAKQQSRASPMPKAKAHISHTHRRPDFSTRVPNHTPRTAHPPTSAVRKAHTHPQPDRLRRPEPPTADRIDAFFDSTTKTLVDKNDYNRRFSNRTAQHTPSTRTPRHGHSGAITGHPRRARPPPAPTPNERAKRGSLARSL